MKPLLIFCLVFLFLQSKFSENKNEYKLVFEDNFEFFDLSKWNFEIGGRHEAFNTPNAVKIENGNLIIQPYTKNSQYFSSVITTENKFEVGKNSYIEIRVKFLDLPGTWSCFWLYSHSAARDEENLLENGLEIDIFEHRKYDCNGKDISGWLNHTIHWNGYNKFHKCLGVDTGDLKLGDGQFHIVGFLWDSKGYRFFVDGKQTWLVKNLETNKKLFLVLSTEIGFLDFWTVKPPEELNSPTLIVDYIKVYELK